LALAARGVGDSCANEVCERVSAPDARDLANVFDLLAGSRSVLDDFAERESTLQTRSGSAAVMMLWLDVVGDSQPEMLRAARGACGNAGCNWGPRF
jgi:hypothetical protein